MNKLLLQLDDVGNLQFAQQHSDEFHVEPIWLAILIQEGIWPQVPHVFID